MAVRGPRVPTSRLDFALGVLVSLGAATFLITLICELTGQPALLWALVTAGIAVAIGLLYRARRRRARSAVQERGAVSGHN